MAHIAREQILHLAELARIRLTEEEVEQFALELPRILDFIAELQSLKVDAEAPSAAHGLVNAFREDEATAPLGNPDELRESFLATNQNGYLAIPQIFDRRRT